ncbi:MULTISPECIES: toll/interleukin-1 receptor domain-containing protein [unclassified Bradyrhizobium]|uniref:toll/interleukin-1 receptor domain-containing protein n=1 Tax=unclassified Bradyrhizobium TaxID=2631580 RepID=UPI0028E62AB3|nr:MULTISPECIES: toll/interleukin-1 receptor domain-containing protein [unclassified Bradyrhizobium]
MAFSIDPAWSFRVLLDKVYTYYVGSGIESTGRRLGVVRMWLSMAGRSRAIQSLDEIEEEFGKDGAAGALNISQRTWSRLRAFAKSLPNDAPPHEKPVRAFVSYKWESKTHLAWVERLAFALRARGIEAILDQWEVRFGESFTDYMQEHISTADIILFVITPGAVEAAEAPKGKGGALKFEVQMMNARRIAEGTRIIGVYRSGDRPPHYLRDHRYVDFRDDAEFESSLRALTNDILGLVGPPKMKW